VLASPAPGEQLAAGRPQPARRLAVERPEPRLATVPAARRIVRAVLSVHAARIFRVAPAVAQLPPAGRLAAGQPQPARRFAVERPEPRLATVSAARRVVRAVLSVHAARAFRVAPAVAQLPPAGRLAAGRPGAAPLLVAMAAATPPAVRAVLPCHAARIFHVDPAAAQLVPAGLLEVGRPESAPRVASARPMRRKLRAPQWPFAHRVFRAHHPLRRRVPPAADAWSVALFAPARPL
jgi:hypothetical protein